MGIQYYVSIEKKWHYDEFSKNYADLSFYRNEARNSEEPQNIETVQFVSK